MLDNAAAHRAVGRGAKWNAKLGNDAVYLICPHGDVSQGCYRVTASAASRSVQLIQAKKRKIDPCSLQRDPLYGRCAPRSLLR